MSTNFRQRPLSPIAVRVLRAISTEGRAADDVEPLLVATNGSWQRLRDVLLVLERRWLITWDSHGKFIRPRSRGIQLLRHAAYREVI